MQEERLPDVINTSKNSLKAGKEQTGRKSMFSLAGFLKVFSFKKFKSEKELSTFTAEFQQANIPALTKALKVIIVVLFFAISLDIFINNKYGVSKILPKQSVVSPARLETQKIAYLKPPEYYLDRVKKRDIFLKYVEEVPQEKKIPAGEVLEPEETSRVIKERAKNLKLVGIAQTEVIEAMIEDSTEGEVYFLKEGGYIGKTEVFIKKIYDDSVILGYEDEEMEFFW